MFYSMGWEDNVCCDIFYVLLNYVKILFTLSKSLVLCISDVDVSFKRGTHVHGKTACEWHMDDIRVHMSDIRMT